MKRPLLALVLAAATASFAQSANVVTHQVNADRSLTFRFPAPHAEAASVQMDTVAKPMPMRKGEDGVWTLTTPPMPPQVYDYQFIVDGTHLPDPLNPHLHAGFSQIASQITVPGATPMPWEDSAAPHGEIVTHAFTTHVAKNLPGNQSHYAVYLPPSYDAKKKGGYPVLYLLHGYTDDFDGWFTVGRANTVLDNMIAAGKAVPMIVVTPLGYGNWNFLTDGFSQWNVPPAVDNNVDLFAASLETEVIPAVEHEYNVARDRNHRAIAGLSMGGLETLSIGLTHPEMFAYVAGMSSAVHDRAFDQHFPGTDGLKANFKLLWVSVGVDDKLLEPNRDFVAWAKGKGYAVKAVETPGAHQWPVWRENLVTVLPMLFR